MTTLKLGTRASTLALIQTEMVAGKLKSAFPDLEIEIVKISTKGDRHLNRELASFGGKGVFTRELEDALLSGEIDMAVHSAKDMPMEFPQGLGIGAVLERGDVRDVIVSLSSTPIKELSAGSVIGTGSLRREMQIRAINSKLQIKGVRGNVQTRIKKMVEGQYDAVVLAAAGLERMGLITAEIEKKNPDGNVGQRHGAASTEGFELLDSADQAFFRSHQLHFEYLDIDEMIPAACQGILAVETRLNDAKMMSFLSAISARRTGIMFEAERSFLQTINAGCNAPAAAVAEVISSGNDSFGDIVRMHAMYVKEGTDRIIKTTRSMRFSEAKLLGQSCAFEVMHLSANGGRWF